MQFTINRSQIKDIMNTAVKAVVSNPVIPILNNVKIDVDNDQLVFTTSNEDFSIEQTVKSTSDKPITNTDDGSITLPARFLFNVIKKMTDDTISFKLLDNHAIVQVTSGKAHFKIPCLPGKEFPHLPDYGNQFSRAYVPANVFKQAIDQDSIAIADDGARPILTGWHLRFKNHQFIGEATDAHRLSQSKISLSSFDDDFEQTDKIIPATSLKQIVSLINNLDENDSIELDHYPELENLRLILTKQGIVIYTRLLNGNYPELDNLIPQDFATTLTINRQELLNVIERATLAANLNKDNHYVKLELDPKETIAKLSVPSNDHGLQTSEDLTNYQITGEPLTITFNPNYLQDALKVMHGELVKLSFVSFLRPFTIIDPSDQQQQFLHLITPIRTF